jgi:polysaccharide biosynthesis transport protein
MSSPDLEVPPDSVRLDDLISIVRRHMRLIVAVVLVATAAAALVGRLIGPVYRAVAVIRLSDPRRALTGGVVDDPARADDRFADPVLSQVELLKSRAVAGAVVDSMPVLRIETRRALARVLGNVTLPPGAEADSFRITFGPDEFRVEPLHAAYGTAVEVGGVRFTVLRRPTVGEGRVRVLSREVAIDRLLEHLRVRPRPRTDIVDVAYAAPDPGAAQQVVNRVVDIFRSASAAAAQEQSTRRREFLETQLRVNDSVLADAREALDAFYRRTRPYGSPDASRRVGTGGAGSIAGLELQRQQLEADRRTNQDLLAALRDSTTSRKALQTALSTPGVTTSPAVTQLSAQLFQYQATRDSLESRSATHPDLPRVRELIATTEASLIRSVQASLQGAITSLDARIAALNDVRAGEQRLSATESEEARLLERVDNARKVADDLRIESQKAGIAEAVTVGQVEIVDHAGLPTRPAGIGMAQELALGLLLGLVLGVGGAVLADSLDGAIARRAQVEQLGLSLLGVVTHLDRHAKDDGEAAVEGFRGVRLGLMNAVGSEEGPMVVAVTSPGPGDGKSFVSSNLALAFAYAQHRTLLVDADLRRGSLHRLLSLGRQPGLTDFLAGEAAREQILQRTTYPCLDFLATGSRRNDAPELMGSRRMAELMSALRSAYEVVIVDTPPLGAGVDALTLGALAGNVVVVLRLGKTERDLAAAKLETLRRLPGRLLGAVLNDVRNGSEYRAYAYHLDGYALAQEPLFRPLVARKAG